MKKIELINEFSSRSYQQSIFASSMNKNSLVVLPTGLGKTVVALMLSVYYFNKDNKKVLFLAPTKPLVEQQEKSFRNFFKNSNDFNFQVLTGQITASKRDKLYEADFIFSTPQIIENDLINDLIKRDEVGLIVFDECHRAVGNYAYTFIAKEFVKEGTKFLGLSASPGTSILEVETIIQNLFIENIEVRKYDDEDVAPYVKETEIDKIEVELPTEIKLIKKKLQVVYNKRIKTLQDIGFLRTKDVNEITKRDLLELQAVIRKEIGGGVPNEKMFKALSLGAGLMKLQYGIELLESQEFEVSLTYFNNFFRDGGDSSKAAKDLLLDIDFRDSFEDLKAVVSKKVKHPKIDKLKELIKALKKNEKAIVFTQYRESAQKIVSELEKVAKPVLFIGQNKKGDVGMSQKDQKRVLEEFREDKYNVLVSTSVGEEGLDIPKVDSVIFYEPIPSAIRTIQRIGRTGRFKEGNAHILQTKDTRDIVTSHIASAKEKRMYRVLDTIKKKYNSGTKVKTLNDFVEKKEEKKDVSEEIVIYVDSRENNDLIKELYKLPIKLYKKNLDVGDIIISDNVAIERKTKKDFINSLLDKRLFPQLLDLSKNYRRPVLILEGSENIFTLRNLNPNVIRASLSSIAVDLRIPIIYTDSIEESSQMILNIAKRTIKAKKDISLVAQKRSLNENEEMEKFVSTIPKINIVTAKSILSKFSSIKDLVNASEKNLIDCEGLGKVRAKTLKEFFEREYKLE